MQQQEYELDRKQKHKRCLFNMHIILKKGVFFIQNMDQSLAGIV